MEKSLKIQSYLLQVVISKDFIWL